MHTRIMLCVQCPMFGLMPWPSVQTSAKYLPFSDNENNRQNFRMRFHGQAGVIQQRRRRSNRFNFRVWHLSISSGSRNNSCRSSIDNTKPVPAMGMSTRRCEREIYLVECMHCVTAVHQTNDRYRNL